MHYYGLSWYALVKYRRLVGGRSWEVTPSPSRSPDRYCQITPYDGGDGPLRPVLLSETRKVNRGVMVAAVDDLRAQHTACDTQGIW